MKNSNLIRIFAAMLLICGISACSVGDIGSDMLDSSGMGSFDAPGESGPDKGEDGPGGNSQAGMVTAGEWNDLENWGFWNGLMDSQNSQKYYEYLEYWSLFTSERYAVTVIDEAQQPVCGATVGLHLNGSEKPVWTAITDNQGSAELWYNINSSVDTEEVKTFTASVNGIIYEEPVVRTSSISEDVSMNFLTAPQTSVRKSADIAFIVDATGSMGDEIQFLKDDLLDIINKASAQQSGISLRTAALFYRDEGDAYVTKYNNFSKDPQKTLKFIKDQSAMGGGDYPEAVHTALEEALQSLSWEEGNYARIAFLLLDAPPHYQPDVTESIRQSIRQYAANGIKLIPVSASGIDKNTEFLLRMMAIFTDGTYVFITNHSGIGGDHIEPTIGQYQVELLNSLIVRLIGKYTE